MLFSSGKTNLSIVLCISFLFLFFSKNGICKTPADLDRVIEEFKQSRNSSEQYKLAYRGLDLYAPIPQKSQVDPDDRPALSKMKRIVITDAMNRAGNKILVTAVGTTGYWVLAGTAS